jgi:hypothetical protein
MISYIEQYELSELKKYFRDRQAHLPDRLDFGHTVYTTLKKNVFDMLSQIDMIINKSTAKTFVFRNAIYRANKGRLIEILKKLESDGTFDGIDFESANTI